MMIELYPPLALHEKGLRAKNEDSIYPALEDLDARASSRFFLVCDGVGGAEKGEEASRIVCESFANNLSRIESTHQEDIERALMMAEYNIDAYVEMYPEAEGMATTLTLAIFDETDATLAHIGDSRIYHLRQGEILFKTADHSLVHEMVMNNIITEEEAANHPKRNVVSRAIMGRQRPARADITRITDIQPGDYFFLCTDGILESVSDTMLASILGDNSNADEYKLSQIFALCQQYSRDNFSAYLLRIKSTAEGAFIPISNEYQHQSNDENVAPLSYTASGPPSINSGDSKGENVEPLNYTASGPPSINSGSNSEYAAPLNYNASDSPPINSGSKDENTKVFPKRMSYFLIFSSLAALAMVVIMLLPKRQTQHESKPVPASQVDSSVYRSILNPFPVKSQSLDSVPVKMDIILNVPIIDTSATNPVFVKKDSTTNTSADTSDTNSKQF